MDSNNNESKFSFEDIAAAEISCAFGALSLYWCQGLGTIHYKVNKYMHKIEKLEKEMKVIKY